MLLYERMVQLYDVTSTLYDLTPLVYKRMEFLYEAIRDLYSVTSPASHLSATKQTIKPLFYRWLERLELDPIRTSAFQHRTSVFVHRTPFFSKVHGSPFEIRVLVHSFPQL